MTRRERGHSRRMFLEAGLAAGALAMAPFPLLAQQSPPSVRPPQLDLEKVHEFVKAGHVDLERTRALLDEQPGLLNACWDWGGGDWETAIGGAGHMGRADIARFLLLQGARLDIFVAAMLGRLDILEPTLAAYPELAQSRGPHGITLLAHAEKGGENAAPVREYLKSIGAR